MATPSDQTVKERGLVKTDMKWKEIVAEHAAYCETQAEVKKFRGETLGYVTPVRFAQRCGLC